MVPRLAPPDGAARGAVTTALRSGINGLWDWD